MRVASVPAGHSYIRHLARLDGGGAVRLADPRPPEASSEQQWWPPVMLQPGWIRDNAEDFDVMHVHFGFDALSPEDLERVFGELREADKPLVYTVHDLLNPHHTDPSLHQAALDVLVREASALITLTRGAADEVWRRWGRYAHILPHPHIVPFTDMAVPRPRNERLRVGVHLKSLRPNMNPLPMLPVLAELTGERDMDLVIDAHTDVVTPGMRNYSADVVDLLQGLDRSSHVQVHVHDYYSDDDLWDYFRGLDVSVLPYRFGTHSGWLEACFDLGTRVLAPRIGYYHDQEPGVLGYRLREDGHPVVGDVAVALDEVAARVPWQADIGWRRTQREVLAAAHEAIYESVRAGGAG